MPALMRPPAGPGQKATDTMTSILDTSATTTADIQRELLDESRARGRGDAAEAVFAAADPRTAAWPEHDAEQWAALRRSIAQEMLDSGAAPTGVCGATLTLTAEQRNAARVEGYRAELARIAVEG